MLSDADYYSDDTRLVRRAEGIRASAKRTLKAMQQQNAMIEETGSTPGTARRDHPRVLQGLRDRHHMHDPVQGRTLPRLPPKVPPRQARALREAERLAKPPKIV